MKQFMLMNDIHTKFKSSKRHTFVAFL